MLDSTHKENIKKTRKTITSIVDTRKLCICQNISLRVTGTAQKYHPEVEKVVLQFMKYCRVVIAWSQGRG